MAQLVARLVRNEKVGGSNPPSSTIRTLILMQSERPIFMLNKEPFQQLSIGFSILLILLFPCAGVAQLVCLMLFLALGFMLGLSR